MRVCSKQEKGTGGVITDGKVACTTQPWRFRGRLYATVVVKATFGLKAGNQVVLASPAAIVIREHTFGDHPARSVERAAETAPSLARCDVLLTGHAWGCGRPTSAARLAVYRARSAILDKTIHVLGRRDAAGRPTPFEKIPLVYEYGYGGPGAADNPVGTATPHLVDPRDPRKAACFAPVPRHWPARSRLVAGLDPASLSAPGAATPGAIIVVPDALPWGYFQAAPPDQQTDYLRGDEWVVLDGLHPALPRIHTQLMGAAAAARARIAGTEGEVALAADMLVLDGDRLDASIVWRGRLELPDEHALSQLTVVAGLQVPGCPVDWQRLATTEAAARSTAPADPAAIPTLGPPAGEPVDATLSLSVNDHGRLAAKAVAPFAVGARRAPAPADRSATPWGDAPVGRHPLPIPGSTSPDETLALGHALVPAAVPAPPMASTPAAAAPPPPAPPPDAPASPQTPAPQPRPAALQAHLRTAGIFSEDIAALMTALIPPPKAPENEQS